MDTLPLVAPDQVGLSAARLDRVRHWMKGWVDSGQLKVKEDVLEGLESLPGALIGLLAGENVGKRMVKVA